MYYTRWCFFVGVYVKFDGLMHPQLNHDKLKQLQSKEGSKHESIWSSVAGLFSKFKNYVIPSSEDETKYSPALALKIYLSEHHKILTGKLCTSKSPTEVIADIIHIFNSLYKTYLQIDSSCRLLPNKSDIQKVLTQILFKTSCIIQSVIWKVVQSTQYFVMYKYYCVHVLLLDGCI